VNGAAIELETVRLHELEDDVFDRVIAVNLRSVYLCMKHEVRVMLGQGRGGSIVNIASTNSFRPQPTHSAYTASKHGVLGITRNAAMDYAADGIRVNAICPGAIATRISPPPGDPVYERQIGKTPLGRVGQPREVAHAALFLASDEASYITGAVLPVDGGWTAI
jgi:NAD(P)-dependent dehydrogenase (short-subunit alcohol dehydrogenase family)